MHFKLGLVHLLESTIAYLSNNRQKKYSFWPEFIWMVISPLQNQLYMKDLHQEFWLDNMVNMVQTFEVTSNCGFDNEDKYGPGLHTILFQPHHK